MLADGSDLPSATGLVDGHPIDCNPDFLTEWEAMSEDEYAASLRDIPDEILDAAPPDLPDEIWLALKMQDEAWLPDPLTDPAGPVLAQTLAGMGDDEVSDAGLIDRITGFQRQASWSAAGQARAVAELASRRVAAAGQAELAFFVDELALALTCTRYAAWSTVHNALDLVDRLPGTLSALAEGRTGDGRAQDPGVRGIQVTVEDIHDTIANVTVRSAVYREYVHLARTLDGWKIVNTLYART